MFNNLPNRSDSPSSSQIILWWEGRRIFYNVLVGIVGFVSVAIFLGLGRSVMAEDEPIFSPFLLFVGILLYGIGANICYTLGWMTELVLRRLSSRDTEKFAQAAFKIGLGFSCVVTSLPLWFVLTFWVSRRH